MPLLNEMARQRASIYRWFAQILYQELTEEALIHTRRCTHISKLM